MSVNIIQLNEELLKNDLKDFVRRTVEDTLNELLNHEADIPRDSLRFFSMFFAERSSALVYR